MGAQPRTACCALHTRGGARRRCGPPIAAIWYPGDVAANWLERFAGVLRRGGGEAERAARLDEVFYRRSLYDSAAAFLAALLAEFPPGAPLDDASLARLVSELRRGGEATLGDDVDAHVLFWRQLAERSGSPYALGCAADTLLAAGREDDALEAFLRAFEAEPSLLPELGDDIEDLARRAGGESWVRHRVAALRAQLAEVLAEDEPDDDAGEAIREAYSDLLDELGGDPAALARIREVGREIDGATERGALPRSLVRRGRTRG